MAKRPTMLAILHDRREHPQLDRHTLAIAVATLVPFLLAGLTIMDR
jgi:hypothetical protein